MVDFGKRTHLTALIQFLKTTKLPNLQSLIVKSPQFPNENITIQKFLQCIYTFFEERGQQLTQLRYCYIPPSVVANSFQHLCNLKFLWIEFNNIPHHATHINSKLCLTFEAELSIYIL